jgi:hypothetical protein
MAQVANKSGRTDEEDGCGETRVDREDSSVFLLFAISFVM